MLRLLAVALAVTPLGLALKWENTGTLDGWDKILQPQPGAIEVLRADKNKADVFAGDTGLKFTQKTSLDPKNSEAPAVELQHDDGYKLNQERWYGFALKLPEKWNTDKDIEYDIVRFAAEYKPKADGLPCKESLTVPMTMWIKKDQLGFEFVEGNPCETVTKTGQQSFQKPANFMSHTVPSKVTVKKNEWMRISLNVKWRGDDNGMLDLYVDDVKRFTYKGATTLDHDALVGFRVGLTPLVGGGFRPKPADTSFPNRYLLLDSFRVGDTQADVKLPPPKAKREWQA